MKRALMYASVASMIQQFNMDNIILLQSLGYQVDVACNLEFGSTISEEKINQFKNELKKMQVTLYHVSVPRKLSDIHNLKHSYKQTLQLMNNQKYEIIHCHSPIGGVICRLANKNCANYNYSRMIYTAHGFHFFKGNNILKNFIFRNIEKYAAKYTDVLITINQEDYEAAKKFHLKQNGKVEYIPGIGIDIEKIKSISGDKQKLIHELDIPHDSILLLSVGELSARKNHEVIVKSLKFLPSNVYYLICGQGGMENRLISIAKEQGVFERVRCLGFRTDVIEIMKSCDIFVFPSLQEGLPVALMEAMASGLPCIASKIRGNIDLIASSENCFLVNLNSRNDWNKYILKSIELLSENINVFNDLDQYGIVRLREMIKSIYIGGDYFA